MKPEQSTIRTAARQVLSEMVGHQVKDSEGMVSSGLIDSLSVLRLIARLEETLGVSIPPDNLQPDDFDSVDYIVATIERVTR